MIDEDFIKEYSNIINDVSLKESDDIGPHFNDEYLSMSLEVSRGSDIDIHDATVWKRAVDREGILVGKPNKNIHMDSRQYEVEFLDSSVETLSSNIIAENMLAQVDQVGHRKTLLDEIIDHRGEPSTLSEVDSRYTTESRIPKSRHDTVGWNVLVRWKCGFCN